MKNAQRLIEGNNVVVAPVWAPPPDMVEAFQKADKLFWDTETTGLSPWRSELALIQIYEPNSKNVLLARVPENWQPEPWIKSLFNRDHLFVGHNIAQFDLHFMALAGVSWKEARYFDTLIGETVVSTTNRSGVSKSLRASVKRRTGYEVDKSITHGRWRAEDLDEKQIQYGASDVLVLPELYNAQIEKAENTSQMRAMQMEMDVMPVFSQMSLNGLPIDCDNLAMYMEMQKVKVAAAEKLLQRKLGDINYGSPVQLLKALHSIGIDLENTQKDTLIDQILFDPDSDTAKLLQAILDWRAPHKRTEMYGSEEWQAEHIQADGRIHARFWQVGADTTRVSSSDPNLQQVPKDGRWIFGNVPGYKIVSVDYSQIEVRIAANISNDVEMIRMLENEDVHSAIAAGVFECEVAAVSKAQRKLAKALVFTLLFGGSWRRFYDYARRSGSEITEEMAVQLFRSFFLKFQGLWGIRQKANAICRTRTSCVITLPNGARRVLAGRTMSPTVILNTPVQGTAAVGMKYGLIEAGRRGLDEYLGAVVHDEAVACVPEKEAYDYANEMQESLIVGMKQVVRNCPVKAEIATVNKEHLEIFGKIGIDHLIKNDFGKLPNIWLP